MWGLFAAVAWATPTVELAYQGESVFRPGLRAAVVWSATDEGLHLRPAIAIGGWHQPGHSTLLSTGPAASALYVAGSGALELTAGLELWTAIRAAPTYTAAAELLPRQVELGVMPRFGGALHLGVGRLRPFVRQHVAFRAPSSALGSLHLLTELGVGFTP